MDVKSFEEQINGIRNLAETLRKEDPQSAEIDKLMQLADEFERMVKRIEDKKDIHRS